MIDIIASVVSVVALWKLFEWVTWETKLWHLRRRSRSLIVYADHVNSARANPTYVSQVFLQDARTGEWAHIGDRSTCIWTVTRYLTYSMRGYPTRWGYSRVECYLEREDGTRYFRPDRLEVATEFLYGYTRVTLRRILWTTVTDSRIHPRHVSCRCVQPI